MASLKKKQKKKTGGREGGETRNEPCPETQPATAHFHNFVSSMSYQTSTGSDKENDLICMRIVHVWPIGC